MLLSSCVQSQRVYQQISLAATGHKSSPSEVRALQKANALTQHHKSEESTKIDTHLVRICGESAVGKTDII